MDSQETSAFLSTASAVKVPCSVSTTNAEIGKSVKKKRSKNRRARQFTSGESSKTEEKRSDDIRRNEHAEDRETSTLVKQASDEKQKEVSSFWFKFVPQKGCKKGSRLPPLEKPHIRLKDSRATVTSIQKYIAQKLNMNDYTEVDVVCCGEKLNGDMTLKDIQLIWMSHLPNSGREKVKLDLEEAVIQLEYTKSEKLEKKH